MLQLTTVYLFEIEKKRAQFKLWYLKKKYYCLWGLVFFDVYLFYFYFDKLNYKLLLDFCYVNSLNFFFLKKPLSSFFNFVSTKSSYFVLASNNLEVFLNIIIHIGSFFFLVGYFGYFFNMLVSMNHLHFLNNELSRFNYSIFFIQKDICSFLYLKIYNWVKCLLCMVLLLFLKLQWILENIKI